MITGNEPAAPVSEQDTDRIDEGVKIYSGLSIRQHFAAMAMQGYCASPGAWADWTQSQIAEWAVVQANALIAELNKP